MQSTINLVGGFLSVAQGNALGKMMYTYICSQRRWDLHRCGERDHHETVIMEIQAVCWRNLQQLTLKQIGTLKNCQGAVINSIDH